MQALPFCDNIPHTTGLLPPSSPPYPGGNAGLAAAYIARELGLPITVVIPETTPSFIADKLKEEGANVEIVGQVWEM